MIVTQIPSASQEDQELRIDHHLVGRKHFIAKLQNMAVD